MPRRSKSYPRMLRFGVVEVGRSKSIVMMVAKDRQHFEIKCVCRQKRDVEGRCRHLRAVLPMIKPWYRQRTRITQPIGED
jgi:hypothetical protein